MCVAQVLHGQTVEHWPRVVTWKNVDEHGTYVVHVATLAVHSPCQMAKMTVSRAGNQFTVDGTELVSTVTERNDLRWTDECKVERIEEQHHIFSLVIRKRDLLEVTINNCQALKGRCWCCRLQRHDNTFTTTTNIINYVTWKKTAV